MSNPNDRHLKAVPPSKEPRTYGGVPIGTWVLLGIGLIVLAPGIIWAYRWALGLL